MFLLVTNVVVVSYKVPNVVVVELDVLNPVAVATTVSVACDVLYVVVVP